MLRAGVYPASVTPFDANGQVDMAGIARLLSWFEACGCAGAVLAGTNGEGPSLTSPEKRDLIREAAHLSGRLDLVLGVATSSLDEAAWLCKHAQNAGAVGALVMPPVYFREAPEEGLLRWFTGLMDKTDLPVIVYNFPQRTGVTLSAGFLGRLAAHPRFAGAKDSSGNRDNLGSFAAELKGKLLFVGDEALLGRALEAGWSGSISGSANVLPLPLTQVVADWLTGKLESSRAKMELLLPAIATLRGNPQPATNKALLERIGIIESSCVRSPLMAPEGAIVSELLSTLESRVGPIGMHARSQPDLSATSAT